MRFRAQAIADADRVQTERGFQNNVYQMRSSKHLKLLWAQMDCQSKGNYTDQIVGVAGQLHINQRKRITFEYSHWNFP